MKGKKITTIEDLATLIQKEFLLLRGEMNQGFKDLKNEIRDLRKDIDDLKLRMGEVAYHFEMKEIEKRLEKLELKAGISR